MARVPASTGFGDKRARARGRRKRPPRLEGVDRSVRHGGMAAARVTSDDDPAPSGDGESRKRPRTWQCRQHRDRNEVGVGIETMQTDEGVFSFAVEDATLFVRWLLQWKPPGASRIAITIIARQKRWKGLSVNDHDGDDAIRRATAAAASLRGAAGAASEIFFPARARTRGTTAPRFRSRSRQCALRRSPTVHPRVGCCLTAPRRRRCSRAPGLLPGISKSQLAPNDDVSRLS